MIIDHQELILQTVSNLKALDDEKKAVMRLEKVKEKLNQMT